MATKPTIVVVPGGWHIPEHYSATTALLQSAGYGVHALRLPSTIGHPMNPTHEPDVDLIAATVSQAADNGEDVVLVMHSSGGACGGEAARGLSTTARAREGKPGGIVRCVYIAAFAAPEGASVFKTTNGPSPWVHIHEGGEVTTPDDPETIFYNGLSIEQQRDAISKLALHSYGAMWSEVSYAPWKDIPSTYLLCENDNAIQPVAQESMVNQEGALFDVVERCSAGHSPFLALPKFTAEVIRRAAGEKVESNLPV
ncbi:alpha/beta-hydrolase [Polychaeton citri CBS 116435]|uniref:Alpha/beta-hydrolase n=1 Tax=Polychaeton citri CBS 116435 TaxID=1314669 RepID=A0A9P4QIV8_9PEZI|nr:alpha/beta-hydrolase [Polychaeton citri CBS 116435]